MDENEPNSDQQPSTSTSKVDTDNILENVERILTDIHHAFFEHYKRDNEVRY